jgi:hypothetical protein
MTEPREPNFRNSVRIIAELLAVGCIGWLASTVTNQTTAIAVLANEVKQLQASLTDMPSITQAIYTMQTEQSEHERRITQLEQKVNR